MRFTGLRISQDYFPSHIICIIGSPQVKTIHSVTAQSCDGDEQMEIMTGLHSFGYHSIPAVM